jgi:Mg-chelatase subunit ChlD
MWKLTTGATTIFGKRTSTEGYDTDVQILVDASGSMNGNKIMAAASLALVVAQAASQVGVDCYAHTFSDDGLAMMTQGKAKPIPRKFAYAVNQVMGGTPLTENILLTSQLQQRRAGNKRRILFVITDGDCNNGAKVLKAGADYVESLGTEIANLHIGSQVMGVFRNEVAVRPDKVREAGLKQLTSVLERGAS